MKVIFWGCRGSIPSPISGAEVREKIVRAIRECPAGTDPEEWLDSMPVRIGSTYGGDTSCVEVASGDRRLIFDAGSGIRKLGLRMMARQEYTRPMHIFFSHLHWDHIQGLPFFVPLLKPGTEVNFYSGREDLKKFISAQNRSPFFPIDFDDIPSNMNFHRLDGAAEIDGFKVSIIPLEHPDGAFGYRVEDGGTSVVYLTDVELLQAGEDKMKAYAEFVRGADVVIADVQYGFVETREKKTWGHSSIFAFADLVAGMDVGALVLYHHEPTSTDSDLDELFNKARKYMESQPRLKGTKLIPSYAGLELDI